MLGVSRKQSRRGRPRLFVLDGSPVVMSEPEHLARGPIVKKPPHGLVELGVQAGWDVDLRLDVVAAALLCRERVVGV